jgi:hypothetical protein
MKTSIPFSRTRTYVYLEPREFAGVSSVPPGLGSRHDRWSYHWRGIHPKSPYIEHYISIQPILEGYLAAATHELKIQVQRLGSPDRKLLYLVQLDLSRQGTNENAIAEQIACAMAIFLLKLRDPVRCPGVLDVPAEKKQSGWAIALRETLQGILKTSIPAQSL